MKIPTPQSERRSSRRGTKRGRSEEETSHEVENVAAGHITIEDCDSAGKFVKIKNDSKKVMTNYFSLRNNVGYMN